MTYPNCLKCTFPIHNDEKSVQVRAGHIIRARADQWEFVTDEDIGYYHSECYQGIE